MNDIRRALMRKFGPLPAWAWAGIAGAVLYLYRHNAALRAGGSATPTTDTTSPGTTDNTGQGRDPVTLDPGQSVYDPNTGELEGTTPPQTDPAVQPDRPSPVTVEPGESIYDPGVGLFTPGAGLPTITPARKRAKKATRHKPKRKSAHVKRKPVQRPTHGKSRPRGVGKLLRKPLASKLKTSTSKGRHLTPKAPASRPRTTATSPPQGSRARQRPPVEHHPSMRQRPAPPRVVHNETQKVTAHAHEASRRKR